LKQPLATRHSPLATDLRGWEWRYLWACCQSDEQFTLCQYTNSLTGLAGSRDGRWLAVRSGQDDSAKTDLWDLPARKQVASVHSRCWPKGMAFSPVSNLLAWGTRETTNEPPRLTLWNADTRREVFTFTQPDTVTAVAFSPDGKLLATFNADPDVGVANAGVNVWQTDSGTLVTRFPAAKAWSPRAILCFSPDGNRLAVGETTGRIRLLDWRTGHEEALQEPREGLGVSALAISPDGRLLAASCAYPDFAIRLWDMATPASIGELEGHRKPLTDLVFLPDSQVLVSASEDCTIRLWDVREQRATRRLQGHLATVNCLALSPDGSVLYSAAEDGTVRGWDSVSASQERTHLTLPTRAGSLGGPFTADGRHLITASKDDPVIAWDLETGQEKESWPAFGTNNLSVALSPDGRWLVVGDWAGAVKIWDCHARQLVTNFVTLPERPLPIYALAFLTPDRALYSAATLLGAAKLTVQRWEPPSWREVPIGSMDISRALWWAESADRQWQAFPDWDGRVQVWDLANDRHVTTFQAHSSVADTAAFSPNSRWLATGGRDGLIKLWEVGSWRLEATLQAHLNLVGSLSFSPAPAPDCSVGPGPQTKWSGCGTLKPAEACYGWGRMALGPRSPGLHPMATPWWRSSGSAPSTSGTHRHLKRPTRWKTRRKRGEGSYSETRWARSRQRVPVCRSATSPPIWHRPTTRRSPAIDLAPMAQRHQLQLDV